MATQEYSDDDFEVVLQSDSDGEYRPHTPSYSVEDNDVPTDYTPSTPSYSPLPHKRAKSPEPTYTPTPNALRCTKHKFYRLGTPMQEEMKRIDHEGYDNMPLHPADEPMPSQPKRPRTDEHNDENHDDTLPSTQQQQHHHEASTSSSAPITPSSSPSPIIPPPSHLTTVSTPADLIRVYADHLDEPTKTAFVTDATAIYGHGHRFDQALGDPALWTTTLARIAAHINTVDADIVLATVLDARRTLARPQRPKNTGCLALDTLRRNFRNTVYNPVVSANNTIADKTKNFALQFISWGWTLHIVTSETHNGVRFDDPVTELYIQRPYQKPTKENLVVIDCFGKKNTKLHYNIVTKTVVSKHAAVKVVPNTTRFTDPARFKEAYP